jgi:hypothetical protein
MLNRLRCLLPICAIALGLAPTNDVDAQRRVRTVPVNVESSPAGATVYVDSADTPPVGTTPLSLVRLPYGRHTLIFKLENHEDAQLPVNIRRRREVFRATLNPLGRIIVTQGNPDAQGASVRIDGQVVGTVPFDQTVQPGRHLVQVEREGYVTYQQWLDVAGGQVLTIPVILERQAPRTGSLLVAADIPTAQVSIDGQPRGQVPLVVDNLPAGEHRVEITAEGEAPRVETVRIIAGERTTINAILRVAPTGGTLRVISNARSAVISLDGEVLGNAPVTRENVSPGEHIVEATADGYEPATQTVTIEAGRTRVVNMRMVEGERRPGRIVVNTNVDGARVWIDGNEMGAPPVVVPQAAAGTHAIVVRAEGYQEFRSTCTVAPEQDCQVTATLEPMGTAVRVEANVRDAQFYLDGQLQGPVPWEGMVPVGQHLLEVRGSGYRPHVEQISLRVSDQTRSFYVTLVGENELTPEEVRALERERQRGIHQAVSHSAAVLPEDLALMDLSAGWPYFGEFRLGVGLTSFLEAGVAFRSFGILNEFEGRVKAGYRVNRALSVGGQARIGGGIGPSRGATDAELIIDPDFEGHSTNAFFMSLEGLLSLHFAHAGAATFFAGLDFHSDRWDWEGDDRRTPITPASMLPLEYDRQNIVRGRFGGAIEFTLNKRLNIWGMFEGVVGDGRRILGNIFGADLGTEDTEMYGRLGITLKFGNIWEEEEIDATPTEGGMTTSDPDYEYDYSDEPAPEPQPVAPAAEYEEEPAQIDEAPVSEPTPAAEPAPAP